LSVVRHLAVSMNSIQHHGLNLAMFPAVAAADADTAAAAATAAAATLSARSTRPAWPRRALMRS
jgi:hypothetical protein